MGLKNTVEAFKRIITHIENFGFFQGLRFTYLKQAKRTTLVTFTPKLFNHAIWLRTNSSDFVVYRDIFFNKQYDVDPHEYPKVIIDAGANIGLATLFFANKFPKAKIIAIEPELENFNILQKNVSEYPNVICLNKAVWYKKTRLCIQSSGEGNWAFSVTGSDQNNDDLIEAITFDEILELSGNTKLDIVKVDIEGAEKEVFTNFSSGTISKIRTLIVETHDRVKPGCTKALFDCLHNVDYNVAVSADNFIIRIQ